MTVNYKLDWRGAQVVDDVESRLNIATLDIANAIAADARILCPIESGHLMRSIKVSDSKFSGHVVSAGGGDQYYATFVELGTKRITKKPFMRPALKKHEVTAALKVKDQF